MSNICSFFSNLFKLVKTLIIKVSKKEYRNFAVFKSSMIVLSVLNFNSSVYSGGKNALSYVNENTEIVQEEDINKSEEIQQEQGDTFTEEINRLSMQMFTSRFDLSEEEYLQKSNIVIKGLESYVVLAKQVPELSKTLTEETENVIEEVEVVEEEIDISSIPVIDYSNEDYDILIKIVEAEASGCGEIGKILVANVIINRVKHEKFPNTIKEVVYQSRQFSPVASGRINQVKVTEETIACVDRALLGEDHSMGALFFMARKYADNSNVTWFDRKLKLLFKEGNHEFFSFKE
jgi:Cell wall hydrolyses involved in spore germination